MGSAAAAAVVKGVGTQAWAIDRGVNGHGKSPSWLKLGWWYGNGNAGLGLDTVFYER